MSSLEESSSATKKAVGQQPETHVVSPYTLSSSDNPGSMISSVLLTGDNYNEWATEMLNALQAKRKTGFINGTIPKPAGDDPNLENRMTVNSMIVGWIRTSIEPKVKSTVTFIANAHRLWLDLKQRFSVGNKVRVHQLKSQLASCRQEGQAVIDYYGKLCSLWEEYHIYKPLTVCSCGLCTCGATSAPAKEREEEKVHQFVLGLDKSRFGGLCATLDAMDPRTSLGEVYSRVIREEQRLCSNRQREQKEKAVGFLTRPDATGGSKPDSIVSKSRLSCSHCGHTGHDKRDCWQLVGFPDWWTERSEKSNNGRGSSSRGRGGRGSPSNSGGRGRSQMVAAHATSSNSSVFPKFTQEHLKAFTQFLQEKSNNSTSAGDSSNKLSVKLKLGNVILDTGASHHMTGNLSLLINVVPISPSPVGFTDGSKTFAISMGVFPLSNNVKLTNGLFVPSLNCTLISDHFSKTLIGSGEERDGVYYLTDVATTKIHMASAIFDQALWHRRLGHPSFSVLSAYLCFLVPRLLLALRLVTQFGKAIKTVRTDNGTKFMCLSPYFRANGIVHQTSCVAMPQQNGRVERKHRHILNVARALLFQASLPIKFWGEVVLTAAYLINRTPSTLHSGRSPYEILHDCKPAYDQLRVFGSACYVHRTTRDKDKVCQHSRKCVFVGYPVGKKGWKAFDIERNEFLVFRDVAFQEDVFRYAVVSSSPTVVSSSPTSCDDDWIVSTSELENSDHSSPVSLPVNPPTPELVAPTVPPVSQVLQSSPAPRHSKRTPKPSVRLTDYVLYNANYTPSSSHALPDLSSVFDNGRRYVSVSFDRLCFGC
ncbi:PREDICTED: uncharacterized protein LOC104733681 [Camelina sativa]|uniref:Uncharacterized protein LOC104733681 n=1 Tax=Camelina sativa TaxID=90675 RepID=A0ABM0V6C7_CAMSA|nr:PREDICTED: uncharacterized protein LOC104733681 [Camelina sativa]